MTKTAPVKNETTTKPVARVLSDVWSVPSGITEKAESSKLKMKEIGSKINGKSLLLYRFPDDVRLEEDA